ncbi:lantibiotic dehydratase [Sphingobacterium sp. UBA5670]|uniref:lantibiotic dehydratase n=1 Tax=Sphingobacterium sp. UBA5670 TaxID=1947502 RepID=UPI0025E9CFE8|nr:lantibiotic dehydratase [Sphingobacterium sp. UBA5670]
MKTYNQIIVRMPKFPFSASLNENWKELKKSIKISSMDFFELIRGVEEEDISCQPEKIQSSILKYLNRSKYRCVPFGTFSSVGMASICKDVNTELVIKRWTVHKLADWKEIQNIQYSFSDILNGDFKLFTNSTYYSVGNQIRYVRRIGERFELAEIERDLTICNLLISCRRPIKISEVLNLFTTDCSKESIFQLLEDLILCGLIITELDPNLIGRDYFQRIGYKQSANAGVYHIFQHTFDNESIEQKYTKNIPALIELLTDILPEPEDSEDIIDFRQRFSKRFDRSDVPLMIALDPELGVGYGKLHNKDSSDNLLARVIQEKTNQQKDKTSFLNKYGHFRIGETIYIEFSQKEDKATIRKKALPNSCSLIGSIVDDHLIVERIGGHSFTQLAGRFTALNNDILETCKSITEIEQNANSDVIFFDIAYNAEVAVDNVNRRQKVYDYELNLINYTESEDPVTLDDLYISVSGKEIVLRSKKIAKRMIPRMSSAYNYRRSDLPVFRFLYDLSYYGIWPDLGFDALTLFPGKEYYPRFQFRNIILSLAKIKITREVIEGGSQQDKISCLKSLINHFQLGERVKILSGEEPLVIDCSRKMEIELLLVEIHKKGSLYIEEFPLPKQPLIIDKQGQGYLNQVIIPLVHQQEVYYGSGSITNIDSSKRRAFLPGKDWLSLEIYGHPAGADDILTGPLSRVLDQFKEQIKCWFFIRYNENGDHLRFRLQLKHRKYREEVMDMVHCQLEPLYNRGLVSDLSLRTYNREMERYDIAGIEKVEQHFKIDSVFVLDIIDNDIDEDLRYIHCLQLFLAVKKADVIGEERFNSWMENIRNHLSEEHEMDREKFKRVNQHYKEKDIYSVVQHTDMMPGTDKMVISIIELIKACPPERQAPFFTDLMHMHINRLFTDQQRAHEMLIYNLLIAVLKQSKYRYQ